MIGFVADKRIDTILNDMVMKCRCMKQYILHKRCFKLTKGSNHLCVGKTWIWN